MTTRIIMLHKSDTATYGDITYTAKGNGYDPVPPLIRRLIAERLIEPTDVVEIRRGDALCFKPCRASQWAARDIVDDPRDGLVHRSAYIGSHVPGATAARVGSLHQRPFRHERAVTEPDAGSPG